MPFRAPLAAALLACLPLGAPAAQQTVGQQTVGQQTPAQQPAASQQAPAAVVTMTNDHRFVPALLTIRVGQAVRWRNDSRLPHTVTTDPDQARHPQSVTLPEGATPFDSGQLQPQQIYTHTFDQAGQYVYFCQNHEPADMTGIIIVEAAPAGKNAN